MPARASCWPANWLRMADDFGGTSPSILNGQVFDHARRDWSHYPGGGK